jgi:predicted metal-dependent HD superfamily phosphohydrolase
VDIDLSILGGPPDEFDAYERAIRHEYAHVPGEAFASGRARILRGFLARGWIYATELFRERYETAARENLRRSLARLESSGGKMPG